MNKLIQKLIENGEIKINVKHMPIYLLNILIDLLNKFPVDMVVDEYNLIVKLPRVELI